MVSISRDLLERIAAELYVRGADGAEAYEELTSVLADPPAPVAVAPEGWKLVPIEPTELMIRRGDQNYSWSVAKIYKAMIEDAPACLDEVARLNPIKQ
ncbi:hypothetical protein FBY06_11838 [Pseudomonas sp. SJZ085]|uniref:hypothetical protein n=1 Tax=unclassified Pseudomonas TaxID=196821 RepID=UPI00119A3DC4|nr:MULTISPECIES: hypothetical protein [unclassified Pseudomonas]TWC17114.1 hypothetical protein FBX99_118106 [Pseudomonas sp. SJZ074]TWC35132.1 hypothetical protein FBY06_11838 [Pseudomonas sp. SJZ085]